MGFGSLIICAAGKDFRQREKKGGCFIFTLKGWDPPPGILLQ